ncbi:MAG: nitrate/nitrite transporter NrtS [Actinomycetota bacterium]
MVLVETAPQRTWNTPLEALRIVFLRTTLRRTVPIALVVGTLLSFINQAGVVFGGEATLVTWVRVGANYLVPFCVSSLGFLSATRRTTG